MTLIWIIPNPYLEIILISMKTMIVSRDCTVSALWWLINKSFKSYNFSWMIIYFSQNDRMFSFLGSSISHVTLDLLIASDEAKIHIQGWKLHQHYVSLTDMKLLAVPMLAKNPCCFLVDILFNNIPKGLNQPTSPTYSTFFHQHTFFDNRFSQHHYSLVSLVSFETAFWMRSSST